MLFYQTALKNESFEFASRYYIIKAVDIFHHFTYFYRMAILRAEILADAVFKCFCFTDIYYFPIGIFHNINARQKRQAHRLFSEYFHFRIQSTHRPSLKNKAHRRKYGVPF